MTEQLHNDSFGNNQTTPLLRIEIQLTETDSATLTINEDDIIDEKIKSFCNEYTLPEEVRAMITDQVMGQLENQISDLEGNIDSEEIESKKDQVANKKSVPFNQRKNRYFKNSTATKGEQLYKRHMEQKPKREALLKKLEQEKIEEELKEAVFKPIINPRSRQLVSRSNEKIEDRLLGCGKVSKEKIINEITKKTIEGKEKQSYRPTLPMKTKMLGDIRRRIRIDEMPQTISGINPSYLSASRNKSHDISFATSFDYSTNKKSNRNDNTSLDNLSTIPQPHTNKSLIHQSKTKGGYSHNNKNNILDSESSKYSLVSMKQSSSFEKPTSRIFHNKIPIPQLDPENNLHDYLYVESKLIQAKKEKESKEKMKEICPFTPNIPTSVRKLVTNRQETQGQFIKRMNKTKLQNEEILINTKIKNSQTERPLFRPMISRGPKNENTRTVSVNLDSFYDKKLLHNKNEIHQKEICNTLEKKKMFLERSMEIIFKMKYEKYKEIFNLLDSDNDGLISSKNIKLSQIDHEVLEALTPLLDGLQVSQENMTFKDFCLKADKELSSRIFANK